MSGILFRGQAWTACVLALLLAACGSHPVNRAPVEDRGVAAVAAPSVLTTVKPPPGFENAGKAGYYTVKPGETLIRIGLENGQSPKDIARWNALENPNKIEVGQVLRVVPPAGDAVVVTKPVTSGSVTTTAIAGSNPSAKPAAAAAASSPTSSAASSSAASASPASAAAAGTSGSAATTATAAASKPAPVVPVPVVVPSGSEDDLNWIWPGKGAVLAEFDEAKNKGLDLAGSAGDPVLAASDGKVVYAGAGLRGYGNLIILKHNNTYLTAYAHNQSLMVKEDQSVKRGQKIAEMGNSDAERVKLHFEVRRQGKPVDPMKYLPAR
jgi:lipoprotein NlpD